MRNQEARSGVNRMKKVLCLLLIVCLCGAFALAEGDVPAGLSFDEGFAKIKDAVQALDAEQTTDAEQVPAEPAEDAQVQDDAPVPAESADDVLARAEEKETFELRFDEGFTLRLPVGWVSYPISDAAIRYALGDGEGRYLYILGQSADFADFDAMCAALNAREDCGKASPLDLNGQPFAAFIVPGLNASACATLLNGEALTFLFTPQDDSDYMLAVAQIMASIKF